LVSSSRLHYTGFVHLSAGLAVGLAGLSVGFAIGIVGDSGVQGITQQPRLLIGMAGLIAISSDGCLST
jgi:F0F1-type ATP synthase membrane subunit c/vacuolar-type H+-ATPase subunit K